MGSCLEKWERNSIEEKTMPQFGVLARPISEKVDKFFDGRRFPWHGQSFQSVGLNRGTRLARGSNKVLQRRFYFLPTPRFQSAVGIHPKTLLGNHLCGSANEVE